MNPDPIPQLICKTGEIPLSTQLLTPEVLACLDPNFLENNGTGILSLLPTGETVTLENLCNMLTDLAELNPQDLIYACQELYMKTSIDLPVQDYVVNIASQYGNFLIHLTDLVTWFNSRFNYIPPEVQEELSKSLDISEMVDIGILGCGSLAIIAIFIIYILTNQKPKYPQSYTESSGTNKPSDETISGKRTTKPKKSIYDKPMFRNTVSEWERDDDN